MIEINGSTVLIRLRQPAVVRLLQIECGVSRAECLLWVIRDLAI
jgi:hypothetical protein